MTATQALPPRVRLESWDDSGDDVAPAIIPSQRLPLIQRRCACAGSDENCAKCAVQRRALPMSMPGDALEVEADHAAGRAMRFLGGDVSARASEPIIQRAASAPTGGTAESSAVMSRLGSGRPLEAATRTRMEAAFSSRFDGVRIHDDPGAAALSHDLDARAFTLGQHVAFASGAYRPGTPAGDDLIAHELAHTIQQRGAARLLSRKHAGGCAEEMENVDEQRDENSRAGIAAHAQIRRRFAKEFPGLSKLHRADKSQMKVSCPGADVSYGAMDLFLPNISRSLIAEIKSVDGAEYAAPQAAHYMKRADEAAGRLLNGDPCKGPPGNDDIGWDKRVFGGQIAKGKRPKFEALDSIIPTTPPTRLGRFDGNPEKFLSCERRDGGAVIYWCTKSEDPEEKKKKQKQVQVVAKPEEQTQKKRVPIRIVAGHPAFHDMYDYIAERDAPPGRDLIIAIDSGFYDQRVKQFDDQQMRDQLRRMQIDPRGVPFIQLGAPFVAMGQYIAPIEIGILAVAAVAAVVVIGILLLPEAAAVGGGALAAEGAAGTAALTTTGAAGTAAATTTAAGATYTTATGVVLTSIEGGAAGTAATTATTAATGTTVLATVTKGSAAAAAVIATILATDKDANAAEIIKPLLDKPTVVLKDITGSSAKVGDAVTADGKSFNVAFVLTTRDATP